MKITRSRTSSSSGNRPTEAFAYANKVVEENLAPVLLNQDAVKSNPKAYVAADDEGGAAKVDYNAVIKRYADKVTNRGSAIRAKCVECSGGALSEVRECPITKCALWPYRMGTDPNNKKTAARLAAQVEGEDDGDEE